MSDKTLPISRTLPEGNPPDLESGEQSGPAPDRMSQEQAEAQSQHSTVKREHAQLGGRGPPEKQGGLSSQQLPHLMQKEPEALS